MNLPTYVIAISNALSNGYRVDADSGVIYGLKGSPLAIRLYGRQKYPTVPLVVRGMEQHYYVVPAHKVVAFAVWAESAFAKGTQVRHGTGGVLDISASNLSLGSSSDNQLDKPERVRKRAAQTARASQGSRGPALKIDTDMVRGFIGRVQYGPTGRIRRGIVSDLATEYGVSKSCISDAIKTYTRNSNEHK